MGDYSFFIKSATFLILINAAIVGYPNFVEALTGGAINTSTVQGTNFSLTGPQSFEQKPSESQEINLGNPVEFNNVVINDRGDLVLENGSSNGFATFNISKFEKDSDGFYNVFVEGFGTTSLLFQPRLKQEATVDLGNGPVKKNTTFKDDNVFDTIVGDKITYYFSGSQGQAAIQSIEDSNQLKHSEERPFGDLLDNTAVGQFSKTISNLIELYTTPSSGNRILGAIFSLYLLGFLVFFVKEVIPG